MSRSRQSKKLQPAKKALKRLANALQSKLQNLSFSRAIEIIRTNTNRILEYCTLHLFLPFKKRLLAKPPRRQRQYNHPYRPYSNRNQFHKSIPAVYIDQLYAAERGMGHTKRHLHTQAETSRGEKVIEQKTLPSKEGKQKEKILYSIEDAWREVVAKSPHLRPVDERAEEFIHKFRHDMKLQKDREEMLARNA
uniref:Uncharacterized protein n=1 Tax=Rhizophora mucronata TaxID=61149 RepID=A0A2P2PKT4_RHIMU